MQIVVLDAKTLKTEELDLSCWRALGTLSLYDRTDPALVAQRLRGADVVLCDLVLPDRDGIAVLRTLREWDGGRTPVMLMTAYACSIGGVLTPIGTPPNIIMIGFLGQLAPEAPTISFFQWMAWGAVAAACYFAVACVVL